MSGICHQILAEFFHTILTYERELEQIKISLAENENFDVFYSFQSIDKTGNGFIDNKDLRILFESHGFKMKKEEVEYLNRNRDGNLKITYKEFLNHLLPTSSVALREKCLNNHYSHKNITLTQSNDAIVEDRIISIYNKRIHYARALEVFTTYDVEPVDLRDSLFDCCEESTGYLDHKKLENLMQKNSYGLELADYNTIKRVIGSFWETKLTPAGVVTFMLPDTKLGQSHHENKEQPQQSAQELDRSAFYAERPHLSSLLASNISPNVKTNGKTVRFSLIEDQRGGEDAHTNETLNSRPSLGFGLGSDVQTFRSNPRHQPEVLIKENPLNTEDLRNSENRQPAGAYIFESRVLGGSSINGNNNVSPRNSYSSNNQYAVMSKSIHQETVKRESNKIKSQYDNSLNSKRELLNAAKQKRLEGSRTIGSVNISPKNILNGMTTINSVYMDNTQGMITSPRSLNYSLSGKYSTYRSDKKSRSPQKNNVTYEDNSRLNASAYIRDNYRLNPQPSGLYELRSPDRNEQEGPKVIDDAYLNRINYLLDKKDAERDTKMLQVERNMSFQPSQSPTLEPNYQNKPAHYDVSAYNRTADYSASQAYNGYRQEGNRNSPLRNNNNYTNSGFKSSPKRDLLFNNEVSIMSGANMPESVKLGSYRFGNNFYDRMLP